MKFNLLFFYLLGIHSISNCQVITSQIVDSETGHVIRYANIGVIGTNIGTVSDSLGHFTLSLVGLSTTDSLQISMIGYSSITYRVQELMSTEIQGKLLLEKQAHEFKEIVISSRNNQPYKVGLEKKYGYPLPIYRGVKTKVGFPQNPFHNEIGTRFKNSKNIQLDSIQINFAECSVEHASLRVNVYSIKEDTIVESILHKPLYLSLSKHEILSSPIVKLTDQNIFIDNDFLITIENYKLLNKSELYLFANFNKKGQDYPTYFRNSSQNSWIVMKNKKGKDIGLSILAYVH